MTMTRPYKLVSTYAVAGALTSGTTSHVIASYSTAAAAERGRAAKLATRPDLVLTIRSAR